MQIEKFLGSSLRLVAGLALAAQLGSAYAEDAGDIEAVFEKAFLTSCQGQVKPMLARFNRDAKVAIVRVDATAENEICGCTVNMAMKAPGMKAIFQLPPEKLKNMDDDPKVGGYMVAKVVATMLQCTGHYIDAQLDPR